MNKLITINDINDERVSVYTKYNEVQLLHYYEPDGGIFIAETPMVIKRALDMGAEPVSFFLESGSINKSAVRDIIENVTSDVEIYEAELSVIQNITFHHYLSALHPLNLSVTVVTNRIYILA